MIEDPIENDPAYKDILTDVHKMLDEELGTDRYLGFCHTYWYRKKAILLEKYNIKWQSPADMNPFTLFD